MKLQQEDFATESGCYSELSVLNLREETIASQRAKSTSPKLQVYFVTATFTQKPFHSEFQARNMNLLN